MNLSVKSIIPDPLRYPLRAVRDRLRFRRVGLPKVIKSVNAVYYGSAYGGYAVPPNVVRNTIGVCCGAGEDISFEIAMAKELGARVHILDPTPRSIVHCQQVLSQSSETLQKLIQFHPYGVWSESKLMRFYAPSNPDHVSHSVVNLQNTSEYFEAKVLSPDDVLSQIDESSVQFLKLNIEGAEYEVIESWFDSGHLPKVICINFDELHSPADSGAIKRLKQLVKHFTTESYTPVYSSSTKVTYLRLE